MGPALNMAASVGGYVLADRGTWLNFKNRADLAVLVDASMPASDMVAALRSELPAIVESVEVFDVYRGKGMEKRQRSLAFRILMQDTRRTLTDVEADEVMALATSLLERRFGAQLRK
jgi:phenylalanyl-tRNA synthetase beta chain